MQVKNAPSQELIEAFHLMWDNFPEPVTLVHKSREVVAGTRQMLITGNQASFVQERVSAGHMLCAKQTKH